MWAAMGCPSSLCRSWLLNLLNLLNLQNLQNLLNLLTLLTLLRQPCKMLTIYPVYRQLLLGPRLMEAGIQLVPTTLVSGHRCIIGATPASTSGLARVS